MIFRNSPIFLCGTNLRRLPLSPFGGMVASLVVTDCELAWVQGHHPLVLGGGLVLVDLPVVHQGWTVGGIKIAQSDTYGRCM